MSDAVLMLFVPLDLMSSRLFVSIACRIFKAGRMLQLLPPPSPEGRILSASEPDFGRRKTPSLGSVPTPLGLHLSPPYIGV